MSKILVIDDDDAFRATLARMLQSQGLEVNQAATGAEGVQLARTERPDLILCDVELGGVGGNLVLYAVRRDPQLAALPFILMSGFGGSSDTTLPGMERGADAFLSKPFTPGKLATTIDGCLRKWQEPAAKPGTALSDLAAASGADAGPGLLPPLDRILEITRLLGGPGGTLEPKAIMDMAGQAHAAAMRLRRRIENCLVYAEIEQLAADWQKLGGLLEYRAGLRDVIEPLARARARAAERPLDLLLNVEDATVAVSADRLGKIVRELLDNAFKYSQSPSPVHLKSAVNPDHITVSISDQGPGMTPDQIARAGAALSLDQVLLIQQGTGLGLPIAQRLTELHNGSMTIQGGPGQGTVVRLRFPRPPGT